MAKDRVHVKLEAEVGSEEAYFKQKEQEVLKSLRATVDKERNTEYANAHKYHCFRCGTQSLVEIEHGIVTVDVCVNKDCGAVHLDPGEMDKIAKNRGVIHSVRKSFLSVFK